MQTEKKVILVVDQSLVVLERVIPMLEELSNVEFVVHAGNYKDAMRLLGSLRPHMILLDIDLPEKNGIDLLKTIKANYENIVIFIVTNFVSDQHRDLCRRLGARQFFDKSSDYELVAEAITSEPF
jgi:DNA-binding NarL/FixJ family response regulator